MGADAVITSLLLTSRMSATAPKTERPSPGAVYTRERYEELQIGPDGRSRLFPGYLFRVWHSSSSASGEYVIQDVSEATDHTHTHTHMHTTEPDGIFTIASFGLMAPGQ